MDTTPLHRMAESMALSSMDGVNNVEHRLTETGDG